MRKLCIPFLLLMVFILLTACSEGEDNKKEASGEEKTEEENTSSIDVTDAVGNTLTFDEAPESIATFDSGVLR